MAISNANHGKQGNRAERGDPSSRVFQIEFVCVIQPSRTWSNHSHCGSPQEKGKYLQVVGTQCALAGISDTVGSTDRIVDHGAGHQLSAILQRGSWVLAAVKL